MFQIQKYIRDNPKHPLAIRWQKMLLEMRWGTEYTMDDFYDEAEKQNIPIERSNNGCSNRHFHHKHNCADRDWMPQRQKQKKKSKADRQNDC